MSWWYRLMVWPYRLIWMPLAGDTRWWRLSYHRSVRAYNKAIAAGNETNWEDYRPPNRKEWW